MSSFKDSLRWFFNKDVPFLEANLIGIAFCHSKDISLLEHGCSVATTTISFWPKSTVANFCAFTESDKDFLEEVRDFAAGSFIFFIRKAVFDGTFNGKATNLLKSIVRVDANQLYPYSIYQPMPTGLYTLWDLIQRQVDSHLD